MPTKTTSRKPARTPVRSAARTKTVTPRRTSKARPQKAAPRQKTARRAPSDSLLARWKRISPERRLDILGVVLALIGLATLLSLLSQSNAGITSVWVGALKYAAGWGVFLLPVALIGLGLWLVLRNIDRLPLLSPERFTGLVFLILNLLSWMHVIGGGGKELAQAKAGGGYIGYFFQWLFTSALGQAGTVIVLLAWLLISITFIFDLSIADLMGGLDQLVKKLQGNKTPRTSSGRRFVQPELDRSQELPPDFHPLPGRSGPLPTRAATASPSAVQTPPPPPNFEPSSSAKPGRTARSSAEKPAPTTSQVPATPWKLPAVEDILDPPEPAAIQTNVDAERARLIETTLRSFGAPAHVVEIHRGPTVTQYGVEPDFMETRNGKVRVRVGKIVSLADDLALALAAQRIRIQAPVPGRSYVGIEVPNQEISRVLLRDVIDSDPFKKLRSQLKLALGQDVAGKPVAADLATMPHLLIAGTTGSGKSVCVNSILCTLLLTNSPADLRLVLVDPKRVELTGYNGIPHLLAPVVVEAERVAGALQWIQREMDARYHKFSESGTRNISEYNTRFPAQRLPYMVVVVDELADLMMLAPEETERAITRLAQLARATGIHLILATQRPSVDVVTGLIKANFPSRIAFAVASGIDSRVILDQPGAERLLGRGDMLFQAPDSPAPARLQGVYVSDAEIQRLVDTWRVIASQTTLPAVSEPGSGVMSTSIPSGVPLKQDSLWEDDDADDRNADPLYAEAVDLIRREGRASITMLQRRLRIGYTRSARLIDKMEEKGIIGPTLSGSQVREVLDYGQGAPPLEE